MSATRTEIFASAAVTAAGNTAAFNSPTANHLFVGIDVTAWGAAGPLFFLQVSDDGGTTWYNYVVNTAINAGNTVTTNVASLQSSAIGKHSLQIGNFAPDTYRVLWTVASGSATFSISVLAK